MRYRKPIACFAATLLGLITGVHAQSDWSLAFRSGVTVSNFAFNKRSPDYNAKWDQVQVSFKPKAGFSISADIEKRLFGRLSILATGRYTYWGGQINSKKEGEFLFSDLDIRYQSIELPLCLRYYVYEKNKTALHLYAGYGYSYTFALHFDARNNYATVPVNEKIGFGAGFLLAGIGAEYQLGNKLKGIISIEVNNDQLLNNQRTQDYGGYYRFNRIPINYNLLALHVGIKI